MSSLHHVKHGNTNEQPWKYNLPMSPNYGIILRISCVTLGVVQRQNRLGISCVTYQAQYKDKTDFFFPVWPHVQNKDNTDLGFPVWPQAQYKKTKQT